MNHIDIFNDISKDFGNTIALSVCQVNAINSVVKLKKGEVKNKGKRTKRITKKARLVLHELTTEQFELTMKLWSVSYNWSVRQSLDGLGGCESRTFKQLLEEFDK